MTERENDSLDLGQIASHLRHNPMLLGTIGYIFLLIFRPYEYWDWLGSVRIERIYALGLIVAVFLWNGKHSIPHKINKILIVFFLVICLSVIIAYHSDVAYEQMYEYFKLLIMYFIILLTINSEKDFKVLIVSFVVIMGLYVGKSLWEFFFHGRFMYRMGMRRLVGIDKAYNDPNSFASTIVYSLPFAMALFKSQVSLKLKKGVIFYGVMCIAAVILTGSRGGMVCMALFFVLSVLRGKRKTTAFVLLTLGVVITWSLMPSEIQTRLGTLADMSANERATQSAMGRWEGLIHGLRLFSEKPLWGWGAGNFIYATPFLGVENELQAHNMYGQLAAELGSLGVLAFSAFGIAYFNATRRVRRSLLDHVRTGSNDFLLNVNEACFLGFFLLMVNGFLGHSLYRYNWVLFSAFLVITEHFAKEAQYASIVER